MPGRVFPTARSLLQTGHIHRGTAVTDGTVAQLRNQIEREQLIERENYHPFRKHHRTPFLQPDFGLALGIFAIDYIAVNLISVGSDDDREVWRMELPGAGGEIVPDHHARALVETLGLTHLRWGERNVRVLGIMHRKRPVRGRLCQAC